MKRTIHDRQGFTIVELLIVIVVIGILAAIVIVAYNGVQDRAYDTTVQSDLKNAAKAIEMFKVDNSSGLYPTGSTNLNTMQTDGKYPIKASKSAYLTTAVNNFVYCITSPAGTSYALAGKSKSGKSYYVSASGGGVQELSSWSSTSATLCGSIDASLVTGTWGYTSGAWGTWVSQ